MTTLNGLQTVCGCLTKYGPPKPTANREGALCMLYEVLNVQHQAYLIYEIYGTSGASDLTHASTIIHFMHSVHDQITTTYLCGTQNILWHKFRLWGILMQPYLLNEECCSEATRAHSWQKSNTSGCSSQTKWLPMGMNVYSDYQTRKRCASLCTAPLLSVL